MSSNYKKTIREVTRQQNVQSPVAQQVLDHIETLLGEVTIDRDMLAEKLEEILSGAGQDDKNVLRKMLDSLFGMFGLNVVSDHERQKICKATLKQDQMLLKINRSQANSVISAIASMVDASEEKGASLGQRAKQLEELLATANRETESVRQERDALQRELSHKDKETLQSVQRILAQHPEMSPAEENEKDALMLYLEDLGIAWSWDADAAPDDFTTYKVSDASFVGVKQPCLHRDGEVVLKGLKYILESEN